MYMSKATKMRVGDLKLKVKAYTSKSRFSKKKMQIFLDFSDVFTISKTVRTVCLNCPHGLML